MYLNDSTLNVIVYIKNDISELTEVIKIDTLKIINSVH